jgi:hypothetical protein
MTEQARVIRVSLLLRKPLAGQHSYERLYSRCAAAFPRDIAARLVRSRFTSRGLLRRLFITVEAAFRRADVFHVTGDAQFLTCLLPRSRTILTIHDVISARRLRGVRRRLYLLIWFRIPMARARVVTVVSSATKARLEVLGLAKRHDIRVIPNFTFREFVVVPKDFDADCPSILVIGTGVHKNVERVAVTGVR